MINYRGRIFGAENIMAATLMNNSRILALTKQYFNYLGAILRGKRFESTNKTIRPVY